MAGKVNGKKSKFYEIWKGMRQRCNNPNNKKYYLYGKRGIRVSKRWDKFENFMKDMLPSYIEGWSIERKNNDGNYDRKNCCWIPFKEQAKNRRNNSKLTFNGVTLNKADWARKYHINRCTLNFRLNSGLSIELALTLPIRKPLAFCNKGHPRTRVGGNGKLYCKICFNSYQRKRWKLKKDTLPNNQ